MLNMRSFIPHLATSWSSDPLLFRLVVDRSRHQGSDPVRGVRQWGSDIFPVHGRPLETILGTVFRHAWRTEFYPQFEFNSYHQPPRIFRSSRGGFRHQQPEEAHLMRGGQWSPQSRVEMECILPLILTGETIVTVFRVVWREKIWIVTSQAPVTCFNVNWENRAVSIPQSWEVKIVSSLCGPGWNLPLKELPPTVNIDTLNFGNDSVLKCKGSEFLWIPSRPF